MMLPNADSLNTTRCKLKRMPTNTASVSCLRPLPTAHLHTIEKRRPHSAARAKDSTGWAKSAWYTKPALLPPSCKAIAQSAGYAQRSAPPASSPAPAVYDRMSCRSNGKEKKSEEAHARKTT